MPDLRSPIQIQAQHLVHMYYDDPINHKQFLIAQGRTGVEAVGLNTATGRLNTGGLNTATELKGRPQRHTSKRLV